ncbi:MAG: hypothetical protein WCJ76_00510 [Comamonadaceae bacterium]
MKAAGSPVCSGASGLACRCNDREDLQKPVEGNNMLEWTTLHQNLETAAHKHHLLASRFNAFAMSVEDQITQQTFHIKGITVSLHLEHGFFSTTFSGRALHFVFASTTQDSGNLIGNVKCFLKREYPESRYLEIGQFTFAESGQTSLTEPQSGGPVAIDSDLSSLNVALHFISASLAH